MGDSNGVAWSAQIKRTPKGAGWSAAVLLLAVMGFSLSGYIALVRIPAVSVPNKSKYLVKVVEKKIDMPEKKRHISPPIPPEPKKIKEPKPKKDIKRAAAIKKDRKPKTHKSAKKPMEEAPREVFGADRNSVVKGEKQSVPVGNTLMKEPEKEFTPPDKVKSIFNPPEVDQAPKYKKVFKPKYPRSARIRGVEGVVKISLVVNENGDPTQMRVAQGIGNGCDEAALEAVGRYRFSAGKIDGQPVKVRVIVPIRFELDDRV